MGIEARGGKFAYVYFLQSRIEKRKDGSTAIDLYQTSAVDVADSDDEAYGQAMKIAFKFWPTQRGYVGHSALTRNITDIDWITRQDISQIKPQEE